MTYTANDRRRVMDARYRKHYNYKRYVGIPTSLVPADRAAEHVASLLDLGWSGNALEQMSRGAISSVTLINLRDRRHATIERSTETAALSLPYTLAPSVHVDDTALVPVLGAERRIRALMRLGWNHASMEAECGMNTTHFARGTYTQALARRWRTVDDMYRRLCMTTGPSTTTARRAERAGFVAPLAWDNIDSPGEHPTDWAYVPASRTDQFRELAAQGVTVSEACRRLRIGQNALEKWAERHGLRDLYADMCRREDGIREYNNQYTKGAA